LSPAVAAWINVCTGLGCRDGAGEDRCVVRPQDALWSGGAFC